MAEIGQLFKILGKDETFTKYCNEIENGKTNNEIINMAFEDSNLISQLTQIIKDENIIKNKMEVIIGQKRKAFENKKEKSDKKVKIEEKNTKNEVSEDLEENKESNDEELDDYIFNFTPLNNDKAIWLHKYCFVEQIDHRMRLANYDIEIFY
jgi:hypothetical protein